MRRKRGREGNKEEGRRQWGEGGEETAGRGRGGDRGEREARRQRGEGGRTRTSIAQSPLMWALTHFNTPWEA